MEVSFKQVVKVTRPGGIGSGVFVDDDLVITAGHVLLPHPGYFAKSSYGVVLPDGSKVAVSGVLCLDGWVNGFRASSDMGILRVKGKRPSLVVSYTLDADPDAVTVVGAGPVEFTGTVTQVASPPGYDVLKSSDLSFPRGVSGGPIVGDTDEVVGIATRSTPSPMPGIIIGLPLLDDTIEWLINNCP